MISTVLNISAGSVAKPLEVLPMKILYFSTLPPDSVKQLNELVASYVPDHALETCRDTESLFQRLSQPTDNISVVLLAADKDVLKKLQALHKQLLRLRMIVILPDKDQETLAVCSKLHPCFLSYTFGNFSVVKTVLKKFFSKTAPKVLPVPSRKADHIIKPYHAERETAYTAI